MEGVGEEQGKERGKGGVGQDGDKTEKGECRTGGRRREGQRRRRDSPTDRQVKWGLKQGSGSWWSAETPPCPPPSTALATHLDSHSNSLAKAQGYDSAREVWCRLCPGGGGAFHTFHTPLPSPFPWPFLLPDYYLPINPLNPKP